MRNVFISFANRDKDFVRRLHEALEQRGRPTWADWQDIPLTAKWMEEVYSGIIDSEAFIYVISPDSVTSEVQRRELDYAVKNNKRILPIWYRDVDEQAVPADLRAHQYVYFGENDDFDKSFEILMEALDRDLDWVRAHTRLLVRAKEWETTERDSRYLLQGKDLEAAEALQAREAENEPKLTPLQKEYVLTSRRVTTRFRRRVLGALALMLIMTAVIILVLLDLWR